MKIHCVEIRKKDFDKKSMKEVREMVGFLEPEGDRWDVTMSDGCLFSCKSQEIAQLIASTEELKAMMIKEKTKIKRQGLNVSINELEELVSELESQTRQFNLELGIDETIDENKRWQINIINKTPECSDTWTLEK